MKKFEVRFVDKAGNFMPSTKTVEAVSENEAHSAIEDEVGFEIISRIEELGV